MKQTTDATGLSAKPAFFINRDFRLLWIGQAVSDLGDTIYYITLSLWIATVIAKNQPWAPLAVTGSISILLVSCSYFLLARVRSGPRSSS